MEWLSDETGQRVEVCRRFSARSVQWAATLDQDFWSITSVETIESIAMFKCRWRLDPGQIEVVDDAVAEVLRRKTPAQRISMAFAADRMLRQVITGSIKKRHPEWSESHVREELARRMTRGAI